jgi:steroid delta-isomerase-like uncharacterized protein
MTLTADDRTTLNTELALRFLDLVDRHEFDKADLMMSDDFQLYFSAQQLDKAQTLGMIRSVYESFADLTHDVHETIAAGDRVVARMTLRGTHTGLFEGLAASGRTIGVGQISIFRVADDRITEIREEADLLLLMQQIGAIPGPAA